MACYLAWRLLRTTSSPINHAAVEQNQVPLGHASIATTESYLGFGPKLKLKLIHAATWGAVHER